MTTELNDKSIWDEIYRKTGHKPGWDQPGVDHNLLELILEHSPQRTDLQLLDSGCGNGRNTPIAGIIEEQTGRKITYCGVDFAPSAVSYCREQHGNKDFFVQDMCTGLEGSDVQKRAPFHVIIDCGCFHAIPPEKRRIYMDNVANLCGRGGIVVIGAWYRTAQKDEKSPQYFPFLYLSEWFFNEEDIKSLWKNEFTLQQWRVDKEVYPGMFDGFGYFVLKKK